MSRSKKEAQSRTARRAARLSGVRIHFIGIGGVSMYSLARLAHDAGAEVFGSDIAENQRTRELSALGITVYSTHAAENVTQDTDLVVYSGAIGEKNPELQRAKSLGIRLRTRAEFMGYLMKDYGVRIGICGTHGKSTTVAMLNAIFDKAGLPHTTIAGEELPHADSPLYTGGTDTLIYEACEYKDSFLSFSPSIAVALNMEWEHVDYFKDMRQMEDSFVKALSLASDFALINADDGGLSEIKGRISSKVVTFGSSADCDYTYSITSFRKGGFCFDISHGGVRHSFEIALRGVFNVTNAVAAAVAALECGITAEDVGAALSSFSGIKRRLELIGYRHGRPIFYDYAHHPTEIRASINTVRAECGGDVTVIFKPHTYSRTERFFRDFSLSLGLADYVIVTDIFAAREEPIAGVNAEALAEAIGERARYRADGEAIDALDRDTSGAVILMGAGDLSTIRETIVIEEI